MNHSQSGTHTENTSHALAVPKPEAAIPNSYASLSGKRIVIVEDEGMTQAQLQKICNIMGLVVVGTAITAQGGIETVQRERPDLVLMDIRMPGTQNGLDAAEEIIALYPVCVAMLTAFVDTEYQERARQIGVHAYIVKPVDRDTLPHQLEDAWQRFRLA